VPANCRPTSPIRIAIPFSLHWAVALVATSQAAGGGRRTGLGRLSCRNSRPFLVGGNFFVRLRAGNSIDGGDLRLGNQDPPPTPLTTMSLLASIQQLADFDTALIANTIGYVDSTPAHEYYLGRTIASLTPALGPTVGVAVTCEMDTSTPGNEPDLDLYYEQVAAIGRMAEPAVWVVKAVGSRPDHECVLGDGMAKLLHSAGCVGIVTDGGVRDVEGLLTVPFAAYARGRTIHHCAYRFPRINVPVEIGGITIRPGDVIHANVGGVIRIPPGCLGVLPERAAAMRAFEHEAHAVLRRTDLEVGEKRRRVTALLAAYRFGTPAAPSAGS
jgi:4-hydroxy-4-methyl-2-oxoglutarate aldolase